MKKKLFLIIVLILLFVFGVLIYDFSDEMDVLLTGHKWYLDNNDEIYVLSLKNNKFTYVKEDGNKISEYQSCETYHYNSNVSMIKLNCDASNKKIYIVSYDNKKLVLNYDGEEKTFYSSKEIALIENFKQENNLTDSEYDKLLSIDFNDDLLINYKKLLELYKGKTTVYVGIITYNINYENVYNYQVLNNLINNSSKDFYLINVDKLSESEKIKLDKLTKISDYNNKIYVYEVNNKKVKLKVEIDALNEKDLSNYKNI